MIGTHLFKLFISIVVVIFVLGIHAGTHTRFSENLLVYSEYLPIWLLGPVQRCQVSEWGAWSECKSPKGACPSHDVQSVKVEGRLAHEGNMHET